MLAMKVSLLLLDSLEKWQAINVASHLCLALGRYAGPDIMGKHPLVDKSGQCHMGICKYPIVALRGTQSDLRSTLLDARQIDGLLVADYPREMLETGPDEELVSALAARQEKELEYLGIAILGSTSAVRTLTSQLRLWR